MPAREATILTIGKEIPRRVYRGKPVAALIVRVNDRVIGRQGATRY